MSKKADMMGELMDYVNEHNILEFCTLMESLHSGGHEMVRLYSFVCDEVVLVAVYLDSLRRCRGLAPEFEPGDFLCV